MNYRKAFEKGQSYQLESGIARLAFANGAGLAIEGPAKMKVVNGDRVEILEGKIAAYVPDEAVGFVVATPGINIIDLGTKFGVEIKPGGGSEVHVFEGQVEIFCYGAPPFLLLRSDSSFESALLRSQTPLGITRRTPRLMARPRQQNQLRRRKSPSRETP